MQNFSPPPTNIYELINEIYINNNGIESKTDTLINLLKKYHLWPSIQVKKFKNNNNLVLIHSSYNKPDIPDNNALYDQCRSVILDLSQPVEKTIINYANNVPERLSIDDYIKKYNENDKITEAYDGTMMTVYNYEGEWYFGTTSCTDINKSRFSHPSKSHGEMFDDILKQNYKIEDNTNDPETFSKNIRNLFTSSLNPEYAYDFVIVHHDNNHYIDYTSLYGQNYKGLVHINSKNRNTLVYEDISNKPFASLGINYPLEFTNLQDSINHINTTDSYGLIIKRIEDNNIKLYKVSQDYINYKEETDPRNLNKWINILIVYMKNRKDYHINDYIKNYVGELDLPIDNYGNKIDATYLIHTVICTIRDLLYTQYISTTTYNSKYNRFKMNKELDAMYSPIIRYHLAQLRYRQISGKYKTILSNKDVYYYICRNNTIKNIKLLINHLTINQGYNIPERAALCITILHNLLS